MLEFLKNEWEMFLEEIDAFTSSFSRLFKGKENPLMLAASAEEQQPVEELSQTEVYKQDEIDNKLSAYFGENVDDIRQNISGDKTQHEVLREYAQYFKPYGNNYNMCNTAFKKYYDDKCLEIASGTIPVEQIRIFQNNMDIFTAGQEIFGENEQFIDSRAIEIFEKLDADKISEVTNILHHADENAINIKGERLLAEIVSYMVDNKIRYAKDSDILDPVKQVLEDKLHETNTSLRMNENWDEEYQQLLSNCRKYGHALDRIAQYEREIKTSELEQNLVNMFEM